MTGLGFPSLSSRPVAFLCAPLRLEKPETDWDDKPHLPRSVIPICFHFVGAFRPENPETDWDDKPGFPRLVIPVQFGFFCALFRPTNPETDWDDKPGLPRLVIPVCFGFFGPFRPENPETDWDDKPGLTKLLAGWENHHPRKWKSSKSRNADTTFRHFSLGGQDELGLVYIGQFLVFVWYSDPLKEGRGGNLGKPSGPSQPFSYLLALLCWFWKRDQLEPVVNGVVYTDLAVSISAWICVDGPGCLVLWTIWGSSLASKIGLEINKTCVIFGTISWILFLEKRKVARCLRIEALRGEPLQESVLRFKHALLTAPVRC